MNQIYNINETWNGHLGETICFEGKISINDDVIRSVDDKWREMFYQTLITPQDIAEHIAFNIIVNDVKLSMLDGFADFPNRYAKIIQ